ncbi:glycosyltransferase [Yoonia sp.]|uniref:glycosyltransferase n=1 Tax=Yoonia sp. TaxID=2212373 RepID=UPI0025D21069|nr:glycosyltransferase [Yoonia sp.]
MKVLHVTPNFFPATYWGGPIFSTKAICDGIAARGDIMLRVLTTDAASPDRHDRVTPVALPYGVHYARRIAGHSIAPGLLARLPGAIAWADIVHLTATYNAPTLPTLALARALGRPVVWSPRGALQATAQWADAPRQRTKHLFEKAANLLRHGSNVLHVTSAAEEAASKTNLTDMPTALIPNCVDIPPLAPRPIRHGAATRLLCLGRLHPKKGLARLIDAMAQLSGDVTLDIYGTGDPGYSAQLHQRAAAYGHRIRLHGHVDGSAKIAAFAQADLFVLPSHSENFGIAVAEALAHGLPVLTTTGTPWHALDHHGCGRCIDLQTTSLACEIASLLTADLPAMGARGRDWMIRDFAPVAMATAFAALYHSMLQRDVRGVPA